MKLPKLPPKASTQLAKIGFALKKNKPEILLGLGVTGFVGAIITGCKASTKLEKVNAENKARIEAIHEKARKENREATGKELAGTYLVCVAQYIKLYGLSFALAVSATASLIAGNKEHREREVAAAVAYAALDKSYKKVMAGIEDRFGKDVADEIRYGVKKEVVEVPAKDADGNDILEKREVNTVSMTEIGSDHRLFVWNKETAPKYWTNDMEYNLSFLKERMRVADQIMYQKQGFLFENDTLDAIGLKKIHEGQFLGWKIDKNDPSTYQLSYNIFGAWTRDLPNSLSLDPRSIIIELNHHGNILNKMTDKDWEYLHEERMK